MDKDQSKAYWLIIMKICQVKKSLNKFMLLSVMIAMDK